MQSRYCDQRRVGRGLTRLEASVRSTAYGVVNQLRDLRFIWTLKTVGFFCCTQLVAKAVLRLPKCILNKCGP
ncbi:MAG: hypothetical protein Ct9H300mP25_17000 [Acidobacteriota bacterium]|nr:MAG: hypothetical protein Ct9H300mP25_17000 [Acidobacteriota bacterium]